MHGGEAADFLAVYAIAELLGKFASEVVQMPKSELDGWLAYLDHKNKLKNRNGR